MIGCDLNKQIEIHNMRKQMYITEKEYLLKKMFQGPVGYKSIDYSGMPHGSGGETSLAVDWEDLRRIQHMIELEQWAIDDLTKQLEVINSAIDKLEGIDAKVKYLRDYRGFRLQEIADKLGYGIDRIKQISCRNPK